MVTQLLAFQWSLCFANKPHSWLGFVIVEFLTNVDVNACITKLDVDTQHFVSNGRSIGNIALVRSSPKLSINLNIRKTRTKGPRSKIRPRTSQKQQPSCNRKRVKNFLNHHYDHHHHHEHHPPPRKPTLWQRPPWKINLKNMEMVIFAKGWTTRSPWRRVGEQITCEEKNQRTLKKFCNKATSSTTNTKMWIFFWRKVWKKKMAMTNMKKDQTSNHWKTWKPNPSPIFVKKKSNQIGTKSHFCKIKIQIQLMLIPQKPLGMKIKGSS